MKKSSYISNGMPTSHINSNSTGRGQSWPHQLWHQILYKVLIYQIIFYLTYSCRNVFQIFLDFWHDVKKRSFDVHFDVFSSEVLSRRYSAVIPVSDRFYSYYRPPEHGRSPTRPWSAVWGGVNKIPISFRSGPSRVQGEVGSRLGWYLTLSQWTYSCCRTVLSRFPKPQRSIHTPQILGDVSLHLVKARSKPNGPQ